MSLPTLHVEIEGLEPLRAKLTGLPADLRLEQRKAVSAAAGVLKDEVARRIHSPGGHARKGIKVKVSGSGIDMEARVISGNRQAVFSQLSRGPNTQPPPFKAARAMARRYGIPREKSRAIAIVIARRGTRGHPVMSDALEAMRPQVIEMFRAALVAVAQKVARR